MMLITALLRLLLLDAKEASVVAANMVGEPKLANELIRICKRESSCRTIGVHDGDAWAGATMYRKALRVGWLSDTCPFHRGEPTRFSVRGAHGLSAAYSLRFLGPCLPPEVLDVPILSALAAARRLQHQCDTYHACSYDGRRRFWAGAGNYAKRNTNNPRGV